MSERPQIPAPDAFPFRRDDQLRITDVDFQRHVNNTVFGEFFASARYDLLTSAVRPSLEADAKLVVAGTQITYLAEMVYGSPVETLSRLRSLGRSSMQIEQIILQNGKISAHAITTMVHRGREGSLPWPDAVRALVAE